MVGQRQRGSTVGLTDKSCNKEKPAKNTNTDTKTPMPSLLNSQAAVEPVEFKGHFLKRGPIEADLR